MLTERKEYRYAGRKIFLSHREVEIVRRMASGVGAKYALPSAAPGTSFTAASRCADHIRNGTGWEMEDNTALFCRLAYLTKILELMP